LQFWAEGGGSASNRKCSLLNEVALKDFSAAVLFVVPARIERWADIPGAVWHIREALRTGRPLVDGSETLERLQSFLKGTQVNASGPVSVNKLSSQERWRTRRCD
jgi:hypothetical protein